MQLVFKAERATNVKRNYQCSKLIIKYFHHCRDDSIPATVLSGFAGCLLMKHLNKLTFDECKVTEAGDAGRSMVTEDMIKNIGRSLCLLTS